MPAPRSRYLGGRESVRSVGRYQTSRILSNQDIAGREGSKDAEHYRDGPEVLIETHLPPWNMPPYFSSPIDVDGSQLALPFYETPYTMLTRQTPEGFLDVITGVSYELYCPLRYDRTDFYVYRNSELLSSWQDMIIDIGSANQAFRFALGGHLRPIPFYGRFDSNDTLNIRLIGKGQQPFVHVPGDLWGCSGRVCITGWRASLSDVRQTRGRTGMIGDLLGVPPNYGEPDANTLRKLDEDTQSLWDVMTAGGMS